MRTEQINEEIEERKRKSRLKALLIFTGFVLLVGFLSYASFHTVDKNKATISATQIRVLITDSGFQPSTIVVKDGTKVEWVNQTKSPKTLGSNPFPSHSTLSRLYTTQPIAPKKSYSFTFNKSGTWYYSDYNQPTIGGVVVVQ